MTPVLNMLSICTVCGFKVVLFVCFYITYLLEGHGVHVEVIGQLAGIGSHLTMWFWKSTSGPWAW